MTFRPWNRTWAESLDWQKDFWHIPEFFELLTEQQEQYTKAITGQQDAKTTLDNIANFQEKTPERGGAHQVSATVEGTSSAPPEGGAHPDAIAVLRPAVPLLISLQAHRPADA